MQTMPTTEIREFEREVELKDGGKRKFSYDKKGGEATSKVVQRNKEGEKTKKRAEEAARETERQMVQIDPSTEMSSDQLLDRACAALQLSKDQIDHLEVEIEFADGTELEAQT